jgi:hypothetical protein
VSMHPPNDYTTRLCNSLRQGAAFLPKRTKKLKRLLNYFNVIFRPANHPAFGEFDLYQNSQTLTHAARSPTGTSIAKTYGGPMGYRRHAQRGRCRG